MFELTVWKNGIAHKVSFEQAAFLDAILEQAGFSRPHPCGGHGNCGKCAVELSGAVSEPNEQEMLAGKRLSCQALVLGDATVVLPDEELSMRIETETGAGSYVLSPMPGTVGAAVDIGTTTVAVKVFDLKTGDCLGTAAALNPQTSEAADVMGRIEAAMNGSLSLLQAQVTDCIASLLEQAGKSWDMPDFLVITGNTTMLYLLTGRNPESLSHAPFLAETLFDTDMEFSGSQAYLPPCMNAFVGADITCAVLASEMCRSDKISLLCDIGTNGEIALWKDGVLYVTSTAAGPAFEGAGISCGCGSVTGAIDKVWLEQGELRIHTIGEKHPVGICGSGLIDAIACGLQSSQIDETGALEEDDFPLAQDVVIQQKDIRAVQLAKAAIAAGIETLLETAETSAEEIETLYITGGFGSHLDVASAVEIGLLPPGIESRTVVLGNAALAGAARVLLNQGEKGELQRIAGLSRHVNLGGNPSFNEKYIDHMILGKDF
ncbi:MAG: DUF4445 domain-containing protein [Acutalibacter sp.]|nr:DUF4445 domain-containing protein [Acutalibacter sp.]